MQKLCEEGVEYIDMTLCANFCEEGVECGEGVKCIDMVNIVCNNYVTRGSSAYRYDIVCNNFVRSRSRVRRGSSVWI